MSESNVRNEKQRFLQFEFLVSATSASIKTRKHSIYVETARDKDKESFRRAFRDHLRKLVAESYRGKDMVDDQLHEANICKVAQDLTASHADTLKYRRFRIGPAQKGLNLYLKYLWCSGEITEPPHCPFDGQVIRTLDRTINKVSWTNLDDIETYRRLVYAARAKANGRSLALWELTMWNGENISDGPQGRADVS